MMPMPPSQWVNERQKSNDRGNASMSRRTDAPVVVNPLIVSNSASA